MWQLFMRTFTKEEYVSFVEEPKHLINPVRDLILFETPFLEVFTKTPWYHIPIAWLPWVTYFYLQNTLEL